MIVDFKLFIPNMPSLSKGTLWILEQIPGNCESADVTDFLNQNNYWSSYNVPYFQDIYNITGYADMAKKYGDLYSYQNTPRAKIFKRDQAQVETLADIQWILRYNNWQYDPLSLGKIFKI